MAKQRQTDVNINYKVNTVDIERGNALLNRASKSTDDLRKATDTYTKQAATGYRFASKTVEGMSIEVARLKQQVKLASTQNSADIQKLSAQYKSAKAQLDAYNKSLFETARASKQTAVAAQGLYTQFGQVYSAVRAFIAAGLVKELISMELNMAKLSGQVEGVSKAFNMMPNATLLLKSLQDATHGTVNDLELMQRALMAQNFKIPLEKLGTLLEFAAVKAQQTGQEVNHLVNYIISGIGYRSIKRLDDLGFTANRVKEALGGVSLQAATMGQIMDAVTKLMNEDMEKTGGFIETAETDVKNLMTAIHDLNVEVAQKGTSRGLIQFFTDVIDLTRKAIKSQWSYVDAVMAVTNPIGLIQRRMEMAKEVALQELITEMAEDQAAAFQRKNQFAKDGEKILNTDKQLYNLALSLQLNKQSQMDTRFRINDLKEEIALLTEKNKSTLGLQMNAGPTFQLIKQKKEEIATLEASDIAFRNNQQILQQVIQILVEYRDSMSLANSEDNEALGIIERKRAQLEALEDQLDKTNDAGDLGESGKLVVAIKKVQEELEVLLGAETKVHKLLADLSDQEMDKTKEFLKEKIEQRKRDAKNEEENAKRSAKLQEYFHELRLKKEKEAEDESFRIAEEAADQKQRIQEFVSDSIINTITSLADMAFQATDNQLNQELDALDRKYDRQIDLAGDNEREKREIEIRFQRERDALEKKRGANEKRKALVSIAIDTATNAVKLFAETVPPGILSALAVAFGAVQAGIVSSQKFAKGVIDLKGPGTTTSDSIPAMLSRGESVMTADETGTSSGILRAVRAKKLNDRVLQEIVSGRSGGSSSQRFDDSKIIKELQALKNASPDIVERGGVLFKAKKKSDAFTQYMRLHTIGKI